ncbi:MAG: glycerol-3-phosphate dehydrogenase, partial [Pseudomonadota bacterium]
DLGEAFAPGVTQRELDWTIDREWVRTGEDFLWRRTKLGLKLTAEQREAVDAYVVGRAKTAAAA